MNITWSEARESEDQASLNVLKHWDGANTNIYVTLVIFIVLKVCCHLIISCDWLGDSGYLFLLGVLSLQFMFIEDNIYIFSMCFLIYYLFIFYF